MKLISRIKIFIGVAVAVGAAAMFFQAFDPAPTVSDMNMQPVYLQVVYDASTSLPAITYQVGSQPPVGVTPRGGGWSETVMAARGNLVLLTVAQRTRGRTTCHIIAKDMVRSRNEMPGPGTISCLYRVSA